jgi:carbon monoxide dehydrogenase subunit G
MKIERTIEIAAPPESVYDIVMDPKHLEDWVTIHHHLEDAPNGNLEKGSELTQCLKLAGRRFHVHWKVVENDPCRRVVWDGQGPVHSHARVVYEFEENGSGTRFSYSNEYDLPGGVLGRMAGGAVRRVTGKEVDATLQRLKQLVE